MRSQKIFEKACELMPGGVNSPVRAYRAVGMTPPFIFRAKGAYIYDVEGHQYVDYVGSWGPMILGHAKEEVVKAVTAAAIKGTSFGAPTNGLSLIHISYRVPDTDISFICAPSAA